jgi:hypothetical protein
MTAFVCGQKNNSVKDYLNVPGPVTFSGVSYYLSWTSHPEKSFYKQEYIAEGDNLEKFKTLVMLDAVTGGADIKEVVKRKTTELEKMKQINPVVNYETFEKDGEYMIDFLLYENSDDGKSVSIAERNVYRYKTITDKSGQNAVLLFGISTRSYGDDIDNFLKDLKATRKNLTNEVAKFNIPEVTFSE